MNMRGGRLFLDGRVVQDDGTYADGGNLTLQIRGDSKSWILRYVSPVTGRDRFMGLGPLHTVGLDEARERARQFRLKLLDGIDPLEQRKTDKRNEERARAKEITFRERAAEWVAANQDDWQPATLQGAQHRLEKFILPKFGDRPIQDFDMTLPDSSATQIVEEFLKPFWRTKTNTGDKCRQHIEAILDRALAANLIRGDNAASMRKDSPLRVLLKHPREFHRAKTLKHLPFEELGEFMAKLRGRIQNAGLLRAGSQDPRCQVCASPELEEIHAARQAGASIDKLAARFGINRATIYRHLIKHFGAPTNVDTFRAPVSALAMELIVLVPARKMQVMEAEWKDIKEIDGVHCLVSPALRDNGRQGHKTGKKTGKDYAIPLSAQAVAVLDRMKQFQAASGIKSDYIFPGGQKGTSSSHLGRTTVNKYLNTSLGCPDITVHGFRHTFGNWSHRNGFLETDSEIALGHTIGTQARNSYKDDIVRLHAVHDMLQAYANYCDRTTPADGANVTNFQKHKAARKGAAA